MLSSDQVPASSPLPVTPDDEAIHQYFGLTYANYLVIQRALLQSMPGSWQARFVALLDEFNAAFAHIDRGEAFDVVHGQDRYLSELTPEEAKRIGYRIEIGEGETRYYDRNSNEVAGGVIDGIVPSPDPVPHYNRGRTVVPPRGVGRATTEG